MMSDGDVIDDIHLDTWNYQLYWTESHEGCIRKAPTQNLSSVTDVICGLDQPQSVVVAHDTG